MATVNITKEFKDRVRSRIRSMHRKELETELPNLNKANSIDASYLFHYGCWGKDHMGLVYAIPEEWLTPVNDARIDIKGEVDGKPTSCSVRFSGMRAFMRPKEGYYNKAESIIEYEELLALPDVVAGKAEALQVWEDNKQVVEIAAKWGKVERDIIDFLDKCKTLNEAVKLFPTVRMYVDRDDIERLERKAVRITERRKIVEEMATDELTAAAIAAKLMGAI